MAKHPLWNDDYWLLLLQLYQKKPMGVKPLYSKGIVDLSLELHIQPNICTHRCSSCSASRLASSGYGINMPIIHVSYPTTSRFSDL